MREINRYLKSGGKKVGGGGEKEGKVAKTPVTRVNKILTLQLSRGLNVKISIQRIPGETNFFPLRDNGTRRYLSGL